MKKYDRFLTRFLRAARDAARVYAALSTTQKNKILKQVARQLLLKKNEILKANARDLESAKKNRLSEALLDRLCLDGDRLQKLSQSLLDVVRLPDPVGKIIHETRRGKLKIQRVRLPLGLIAIIYESRPNVTMDAAALCFKAGNGVVLRGGREAFHSNQILGKIFQDVLRAEKIPVAGIAVFPKTDRELAAALLKRDDFVDVAIPRGGPKLMEFVRENATVPVIKHDKGVCTLFVDASADVQKSLDVVLNAKVQRPGVCNALENLLVHEEIAESFLPLLQKKMSAKNVELRGDLKTQKILKKIKRAMPDDWETEYLDLILSIAVVKDVDAAIRFIQKYSSRHTDGILSQSLPNISRFVSKIDSSCVVINASTRFNDGGELGLGAEIGISTTKMHAYGPMGLEELTIPRFVVTGSYSVRS